MSITFRSGTGDEEWTTKIDALAARLDIKPLTAAEQSDGQMKYMLSVNNGERRYNLLDLMNAVLDRCDEAIQRK